MCSSLCTMSTKVCSVWEIAGARAECRGRSLRARRVYRQFRLFAKAEYPHLFRIHLTHLTQISPKKLFQQVTKHHYKTCSNAVLIIIKSGSVIAAKTTQTVLQFWQHSLYCVITAIISPQQFAAYLYKSLLAGLCRVSTSSIVSGRGYRFLTVISLSFR